MMEAAFYSLTAITLLSALGVVLARNTLHAALLLGLCLAGVGGLFATLGADFLFGGQILIYVGGIAVLMTFVVMLAGRASELHLRQVNDQWLAALLICGVTFMGMQKIIDSFSNTRAPATTTATTAGVGRILLDEFAVPFEIISVILVAALVGAVVFSRPRAKRDRS
ncbi:MAG: NADH-quinone oxidoreductase subunit J [Elusimicrobiota bacterium]|jgi:NADH-quinone oxidoreductase subunit J